MKKQTVNYKKGQKFQLENLEVEIVSFFMLDGLVKYKCEVYKNNKSYAKCDYAQDFLKTLYYLN